MGLIGTGWQAQAQLEALSQVRTISEVRVFSRDSIRRQDFAARMAAQFHLPVHAASSAQAAVDGATLMVTATSSPQPVLETGWLRGEQFLAAIGSNWPEKRELGPATIARARRRVCDRVDACRREAGELIAASDAGLFSWEQAIELSQVVADGRAAADSGLTIFKSVGLAIEDLAAAALMLV